MAEGQPPETSSPQPQEVCQFWGEMCNPTEGLPGCAVYKSFKGQINYNIGPNKGEFRTFDRYEDAMNHFASEAENRGCLLAQLVAKLIADAIAAKRAGQGDNPT